MKRIKNIFSRRDFMKNSAFVTAAGAGLMVGSNPELEVASAHKPAAPAPPSATRVS